MRGFLTDSRSEVVEVVFCERDGVPFEARYGATRLDITTEMVDSESFIVIPADQEDIEGAMISTSFGTYVMYKTEDGWTATHVGKLISANGNGMKMTYRIMDEKATFRRVEGMPWPRDIQRAGIATCKRLGHKVHYLFDSVPNHLLDLEQDDLTLTLTSERTTPWGKKYTTSNMDTIRQFLMDYHV
ncbi:hypothetical protein SM033_00057 [Vibrio phage vB_VpaM_sm033]|nr:hypothetical protein SM033_00057 [Vibrio phage vB_VpaM_sm033]